ncbi:MAG: glycosyltransferase family 2 protein [Oscillospiraceae bacterium]|nr:glycosyltransferase family 2 protein [Oscillospiraceae bacterium]
MSKLYIVMPAYNEQDNIEAVVSQWHGVVEKIGDGSRLLIVNDGSRDDTSKVLHSLEGQYPCLAAVDKENSGHGSTCLFAYNKAVEAGADYVFQTDSDGQTSPDEFWGFWDKRDEYDVIIGTRLGREDGFSRKVVTRVLRLVLLTIFGVWVKDANTPFRLIGAEKLKSYLNTIPKDFFLSNALMSATAVYAGDKILWLPITFRPRQGGVNSINLKRIIKIGFKALSDFRIAKGVLKNEYGKRK